MKTLRIASQASFFGLFVYIFIRSLDPFSPAENPFLKFDFLIFLTHLRLEARYLLPTAGVIALTLVAGRYFCGWVCPLGSLVDGLDLALSPLRRRNPLAGRRAVFAGALRSSPPSWFILGASLAGVFFTFPILQFFHPHVWIVRVFSLSALGLAFAGLLALFALFARRFWCAYVCPLGAFYGLIGKISLFRLSIAECSRCGHCLECPMGAADFRTKEVIDHQCILCFDFEARCPAEGFRYGPRFHGAGSTARATAPVGSDGPAPASHDESRRLFLRRGAAVLGGLAAGSLLSVFERGVETPLLRPPGVVDERGFVKRCVRCFQCVRSCPNGIIKITGLEKSIAAGAGFGSLFTPSIEFNEFGCDYNCQVCQRVCPNYAIPLQSLEEKQRTRIGFAFIDRRRCVVFAHGRNCIVCEEFCPVPGKAIALVDRTWVVDGRPLLLRYPFVVPHLCIGCGKCEGNCPVEGKAIRVFKA